MISINDNEAENYEKSISENSISLNNPITVILGQPGGGKSRLMQRFEDRSGGTYVTANHFVRNPNRFAAKPHPLIIDAVDELATSTESHSVDQVLGALEKINCPHCIISCRGIEWQDATDRSELTESYGSQPDVYDIEPLQRSDAKEYLQKCRGENNKPILDQSGMDVFTASRIQSTLVRLDEAGLSAFYTNAYDLTLLAESMAAGSLPNDREELYELAAVRQATEHSKKHEEKSSLASVTPNDVLDAAGLIALAELVSGAGFVALIESQKDGSKAISRAELTDLPKSGAFDFACASRLIDPMQGQRRVRAVHRTMGDYLAARYIQSAVDLSDPRIVRRVWRSLVPGKHPSADRRGLIAWLARHPSLQDKALFEDPVGYIYYGEASKLNELGTLGLLNALVNYSEARPEFYYRQGRWDETGRLGRGGKKVLDRLRSILFTNSEASNLKMFILDQLTVSQETTLGLEKNLSALIIDIEAPYSLRFRALKALLSFHPAGYNWASVIDILISEQNFESYRLGLQILRKVSDTQFTAQQIAAIIGGVIGLNPDIKNFNPDLIGTLWALPEKITAVKLIAVLEQIRMHEVFNEPIVFFSRDETLVPNWAELGRFINDSIIRIEENIGPDNQRSLRWFKIVSLAILGRETPESSSNYRFIQRIKNDENIAKEVTEILLAAPKRHPKTSKTIWMPEFYDVLGGNEITDAVLSSGLNYVISKKDKKDEIDDHSWGFFTKAFENSEHFPNALIIAQKASEKGAPFEHYSKEAISLRKEEINSIYKESKEKRDARKFEEDKNWAANVDRVKNALDSENPPPSVIFYLSRALLGHFSCQSGEMASYQTLRADFGELTIEKFENELERHLSASADLSFQKWTEDGLNERYNYPMLFAAAAASLRFTKKLGFGDLDRNQRGLIWLSTQSDHYRSNHHLNESGEAFKDALKISVEDKCKLLDSAVRIQLQNNPSGKGPGIISLMRWFDNIEPSSLTKTIISWLKDFPRLEVTVEEKLLEQLAQNEIDEPSKKTFIEMAHLRAESLFQLLKSHEKDESCCTSIITVIEKTSSRYAAIAFKLDEKGKLPKIDHNLDLLRAIYNARSGSLSGKRVGGLSVAQTGTLISSFRTLDSNQENPNEDIYFGSGGKTFLRNAITQMGDIKSIEASGALEKLAQTEDIYTPLIRTLIDERTDHISSVPVEVLSAIGLKAMLSDGLPQTPSQFLSLGEELLETLQQRLNNSKFDTYNLFYRDPSKPKPGKKAPKAEKDAWNKWDTPKDENDCNKVVADVLRVPPGVIRNVELTMANNKRADLGLEVSNLILPIEAKGQWNKEVYSAAMGQLDKKYAAHFKAKGFGIFLVYWFGYDVADNKKRPVKYPLRGKRPASPEELKEWIEESLPAANKDKIKVVVLDLTKGHG